MKKTTTTKERARTPISQIGSKMDAKIASLEDMGFIPKNEEYWRFLENEVLEQIVYYENKNYIPLLMSTEPATMWPRDCIPRGQQLALWHMIWDLADIVVLCRLGCGNVPQYL